MLMPNHVLLRNKAICASADEPLEGGVYHQQRQALLHATMPRPEV